MFSSIIDYIYSFFTQTFFGGAIKVNNQWYFLNPPDDNNASMLCYRSRLDVFEEIEYMTGKLSRFNYKVDQFTLIRLHPKSQTISVPSEIDIPFDNETKVICIEPLSDLVSSH